MEQFTDVQFGITITSFGLAMRIFNQLPLDSACPHQNPTINSKEWKYYRGERRVYQTLFQHIDKRLLMRKIILPQNP